MQNERRGRRDKAGEEGELKSRIRATNVQPFKLIFWFN